MLACFNSSNFVCILERLLELIFHICGFALQNGEENGFRGPVEDVRKRLLNSFLSPYLPFPFYFLV